MKYSFLAKTFLIIVTLVFIGWAVWEGAVMWLRDTVEMPTVGNFVLNYSDNFLAETQIYVESLNATEYEDYTKQDIDTERTWSCEYEATKLVNMSAKSFKNAVGYCTGYARAGSEIYFNAEKLSVNSPSAFRILGSSLAYASDGIDVYFYGSKLSDVDTNSFSPLYDTNGNETLLSSDRNGIILVNPHSRIVETFVPIRLDDLQLWKNKYGWNRIPVLDTSN